MMRIRTIKPEWLEDERMAEASSDARVLSVALILLADDAGRGRLNRATAARCFPADPATFDRAFAELSGWFVQRYDVRGQGYYAIVNWSKHQRIDKPSKPRTPEPEEITIKANDCDDISKKRAPQEITTNGDACEPSRDPRETLARPPGPFADGPGPGPGPIPPTAEQRARVRVASAVPSNAVRDEVTPARLWRELDDAWFAATGERMPGLFTGRQRMDLGRLMERHGAEVVRQDMLDFVRYVSAQSEPAVNPWGLYLSCAGAWARKAESYQRAARAAAPRTGILDADETEAMMARKMRGGG